jgi:hypothetical protein
MNNSNDRQKLAYENAKKRRMELTVSDSISHLECEILEFKTGHHVEGIHAKIKLLKSIHSPEIFKKEYERLLKNSIYDELADLFIIPMTLAEILEVNLLDLVDLKQHYNIHRE